MSYKNQIHTLETNLKLLENQISNTTDSTLLTELKNKHNDVFNELRRLNRLQWEEDHERVNFDDDR